MVELKYDYYYSKKQDHKRRLEKNPEFSIDGLRCTEKILSRVCVVSGFDDSEYLGQFFEKCETCKFPAKKVGPYIYSPVHNFMPVSKGVVLPNWYSYYYSEEQEAVQNRLGLPVYFIDGVQYTNRLSPFEINVEYPLALFLGDFHCILESEEERYWEYE